MPVRESGRFVKNPSVFLKKVEFTRDYEIENGVAVPKHIQSRVDTRVVGRADISIDYTAPKKLDAAGDQPTSAAVSVEQAKLGH
jgi:hypothetical protein